MSDDQTPADEVAAAAVEAADDAAADARVDAADAARTADRIAEAADGEEILGERGDYEKVADALDRDD